MGGYLLGGAVLASGVHLYRRWSSRSSDPELQVRVESRVCRAQAKTHHPGQFTQRHVDEGPRTIRNP